MAPIPARLLDWYLPRRRAWEIGAWVTFAVTTATFNAITVALEFSRRVEAVALWKPFLWEYSSLVVTLALVPAVIAYERRFPIRFDTWLRSLPWHVLGSLGYSVVHVVGMVALREVVYAAAGERYDFGHWGREFLYEYLKDVRGYAFILAVVLTYRFVLLRLQGEVRLLVAPETGPPTEPVDRPERFLVRKLGSEFLVAARDVEWLEAAENYVNLHVRGHAYPLRSTMNAIEKRLDPQRFVRVHRRYIVNLDCLAQIQPLDTGDAKLVLKDGTQLQCSRTYRDRLRAPHVAAA